MLNIISRYLAGDNVTEQELIKAIRKYTLSRIEYIKRIQNGKRKKYIQNKDR